MKRTHLFEKHLELRAKMGEFAGFEMPIQYTSVKEEVLAVRHRVGRFDVSHMGAIFVKGPGSVAFVDYLLCNDFLNLPVGKALYSPLCNESGGILDDLIAYKLSGEYVLICVNACNINKDWQWMQSHAGDFEVDLSNCSESMGPLAIQGPRSCDFLKAHSLLPPGEFPYYSAATIEDDLIVARTGYTGEDGFELFAPYDKICYLWESLKDAAPCGLAARDVLRIEAGFPLYGNELTEQWGPYDANLSWTVKLDSGNFIGKKALAEQGPRFRQVKLSLDRGIPRSGYVVRNAAGEDIGRVLSGTFSVSLERGICLALVEREKLPRDKVFFIGVRNRNCEARYHPKTFIKKGQK